MHASAFNSAMRAHQMNIKNGNSSSMWYCSLREERLNIGKSNFKPLAMEKEHKKYLY